MRLLIAYLIMLLPWSCFSQNEDMYKTNNGTLTILSEAPLEVISANSVEMKGLIDPDKRTLACELTVKSLKGFNSPLQQEHFYENYMETDRFPKASFSGKIIEIVDFNELGKHSVRVKGQLIIHGVSVERIIPVTIDIQDDKINTFSEFSVSISDHDITVPKLVYQKISEEITVTIQAEFRKMIQK